MRLISAINGRICTLAGAGEAPGRKAAYALADPTLSDLLPTGLARGAVHELVFQDALPRAIALFFAAAVDSKQRVVWSDPAHDNYAPCAWAMGISPERLFLLHATDRAAHLWAVTECLRCPGVGATIATLDRLSQIESRRLQLAAEAGGGIGIFLRPQNLACGHYAAASRWLINRHPGDGEAQQWRVELIHGHGGSPGKPVIIGMNRDTHHVRTARAVAARPAVPPQARTSA